MRIKLLNIEKSKKAPCTISVSWTANLNLIRKGAFKYSGESGSSLQTTHTKGSLIKDSNQYTPTYPTKPVLAMFEPTTTNDLQDLIYSGGMTFKSYSITSKMGKDRKCVCSAVKG